MKPLFKIFNKSCSQLSSSGIQIKSQQCFFNSLPSHEQFNMSLPFLLYLFNHLQMLLLFTLKLLPCCSPPTHSTASSAWIILLIASQTATMFSTEHITMSTCQHAILVAFSHKLAAVHVHNTCEASPAFQYFAPHHINDTWQNNRT